MGSNSSKGSRSSLQTSGATGTVQKPSFRKQQKPRAGTLQADGTPIPVPPINSKADLLQGLNFDLLDEIALQAPLDILLGTFWDVVEYLVITPEGDVLDDLSKARMFFRWMTSFDVYTIDTEIIPPEESPLEYFLKIQYDLGDHAHLFYSLCKMADIPCVVIDGMSKGGGYEIGEAVDRDKMQGKWNAVLVSGEWRLIDTFWAKLAASRQSSDVIFVDSKGKITRESEDKNLEFSVNEFFFLCDPDHLIHTHFPDDRDWQLMDDPIDVGAFERNAYVREQYHKLGLSIPQELGQTNCVIKTQDDAIKIALNIPKEIKHNVKFKYALLQTRKQVETEKEVDMVFERFVRMEHRTNTLKLKLRFPITGRFLFDVYAADMWSSSRYELVCTYIIHVSKKTKNHKPFPDCPVLGWGPNPLSEMAGLVPKTPEETSIRTANGVCQICVSRRGILDINHALRNILMDEAVLTKHAIGKFDDDRYIVDIILPEEGEYALKIFASTKQALVMQTTDLLTFLIKYQSSSGKRTNNTPFPIIASAHVGKKDGYSKLGVQALTYKGEYVDVLEGEGSFVFKADEKVQLLCELACAKKEGQSRLSVSTKQERDRWIFVADMPIAGEYSLNIFAIEKNDPLTLHEVQTYRVHSNGRPIKEVKFTDDFGPDDIVVETIKTSEDTIVISVPNPVDGEVLYANICRRDAKKNEGENRATVLIRKDSLEIKFKSDGEYLLEIYEKEQANVVTTIARFAISKSPSFKTYTSDIDALVKMLKPQEKSRKFKNALEEKRQKKALAKKKKEEELLRKEQEERKRKEEEAKKKLEKEKPNKKHKKKNKLSEDKDEGGTEDIKEREEERSISPDTLAAALEIAKAAEQEEKEKRLHTTASGNRNRNSPGGIEKPVGDISPERLAAAVDLITTAQMNANGSKYDTHINERSSKNTKDKGIMHGTDEKKQTLDRHTLNAALSIIAVVEAKSNGKADGQTPNLDTETIAAAREIIALANEEGMTVEQNVKQGDVRKNSNVSSIHTTKDIDTEALATAAAIVTVARTNLLERGKKQDKANTSSSNKERNVSQETLAAASAIVAVAKQNVKMRHIDIGTEGKAVAQGTESLHEHGSSESLSSEVIAAAVSIVSSVQSPVRVADSNVDARTKTTKAQVMSVGATSEDIDPETLAAAVALVVASKKHDETNQQKKMKSSKKKSKPQNTATPRKSGHATKDAEQTNTCSKDSIEMLNYTSDASNLSSQRVSAATALPKSSTNQQQTSSDDTNNSTKKDMSKSSSVDAGAPSKKDTNDQQNTSKNKGAVDNKTGTSQGNVRSISPSTLSAAVALVSSTNDATNDATNVTDSKNGKSGASADVGKAKSSTKSSVNKQIIDPSTLAAATAIVKASGRTRGTFKRNSETKDGSKNLQITEQQSGNTSDIDPETLKAAALIVAAASHDQDIKTDIKQSPTYQKDNNVSASASKNKNEPELDETFDYTKMDTLSPAALAAASNTIAASISKLNDAMSKNVNIGGTTSNAADGKPFPTSSDKESQRSFSPNTIAAAHAIVATSKRNNGNQTTTTKDGSPGLSNGDSTKTSSYENMCVSPNTLASALSIISASENHSTTWNEQDNPTSDGAKKKETTEMNKQTKKRTKKVNVVSGRINMNGAKGRKVSITTTTPRQKQNIKKVPIHHKDVKEDVGVNDDDYHTDSTLHSSNFDSESEYDSEEERLAEVRERKKSVAQAMKKKDLKGLVYQLQEFKKTKDPQNEVLVEEATRMVSQLRAKEDLKIACSIREVPALERAIRKAKKVNDGKAIDIQIILASQLLKRLNRIERLSQTVLQINQNALVEMKKYVTPPPGVHEALHATFLILGEESALLTTWKSCQSLLFKTGKENIMRRITNFNPKLISKDVAATAKKIIAPYSVLQIRDVSFGASAFYVWAKGMIGEIETTGKSGSRPEKVRSTHQLPPRSAVLVDDTIERADTIIMMM